MQFTTRRDALSGARKVYDAHGAIAASFASSPSGEVAYATFVHGLDTYEDDGAAADEAYDAKGA